MAKTGVKNIQTNRFRYGAFCPENFTQGFCQSITNREEAGYKTAPPRRAGLRPLPPFSRIYVGDSWAVLAKDGEAGQTGQKGDPGDKGDPGEDGASLVWKGDSAGPPANAQALWAYFNTTDGNAYIYNGSGWVVLVRSGASLVWQGELAQDPANPQVNWAYYNSEDKQSYIYDGDSWEVLAKDGSGYTYILIDSTAQWEAVLAYISADSDGTSLDQKVYTRPDSGINFSGARQALAPRGKTY
jgi:hypothetical protein